MTVTEKLASYLVNTSYEDLPLRAVEIAKIARVNCFVTKAYLDAASPFPEPTCPDEARYSLPYQIAIALLDGQVGIDQHTEERMSKSDIREMITRVNWTELSDDRLDPYDVKTFKRMEVPKISFIFKNGTAMTVEPEIAHGDSDPFVSCEEILAKYRDCAGRVISLLNVEQSIALVAGMDGLESIKDYTRVLM